MAGSQIPTIRAAPKVFKRIKQSFRLPRFAPQSKLPDRQKQPRVPARQGRGRRSDCHPPRRHAKSTWSDGHLRTLRRVPLWPFFATRAFPSGVRGPVDRSHGRTCRISSDCRRRRSGVHPLHGFGLCVPKARQHSFITWLTHLGRTQCSGSENLEHLVCGVLRVPLAYRADANSFSSPAIKPPTYRLVHRIAFRSGQPTFSQQLPGPVDTEKMLES